MSDDRIVEVRNGSSWQLPAIIVLGLVALGCLAFGWNASSKLDSTEEGVAAHLKPPQQSVQQDMFSLKARLAQDEKANTHLQGDLKLGVGFFVLREAVLQGRHILLDRLLG